MNVEEQQRRRLRFLEVLNQESEGDLSKWVSMGRILSHPDFKSDPEGAYKIREHWRLDGKMESRQSGYPNEPSSIRFTPEGLAYVEKALVEQEEKMRWAFLRKLYAVCGGSRHNHAMMQDIGSSLGLDRKALLRVADYLSGEMLIEHVAIGGRIALTHGGIVAVESERLGRSFELPHQSSSEEIQDGADPDGNEVLDRAPPARGEPAKEPNRANVSVEVGSATVGFDAVIIRDVATEQRSRMAFLVEIWTYCAGAVGSVPLDNIRMSEHWRGSDGKVDDPSLRYWEDKGAVRVEGGVVQLRSNGVDLVEEERTRKPDPSPSRLRLEMYYDNIVSGLGRITSTCIVMVLTAAAIWLWPILWGWLARGS